MSVDTWTNCPACGSDQFHQVHDQGINGQHYGVTYWGKCRTCGFTFEHEDQKRVIADDGSWPYEL